MLALFSVTDAGANDDPVTNSNHLTVVYKAILMLFQSFLGSGQEMLDYGPYSNMALKSYQTHFSSFMFSDIKCFRGKIYNFLCSILG